MALSAAGSIAGRLLVCASDFVRFVCYSVVIVLRIRVKSDIEGKTWAEGVR